MPNFSREIDGQEAFYDKFALTNYVTIDNNTDGYLTNGGAIFEFKVQIDRVDEVLFQAIKYLSRLRLKGCAVHKNIVLVSLNDEKAYCYDSANFLNEIEQIYVGGASKNNGIFSTSVRPNTIHYGRGPEEMQKLLALIDYSHPKFTKIHIDLSCVVGWANRFYRETNKSKSEMFDELRHPTIFSDYIYPWLGKEEDFKFIMDCLNDLKHRRELGAFYTPKIFAKRATDLVRKAIARIPVNYCCTDPNCEYRVKGEKEHKHYVIIDRCAGTGVLQENLSDEELAHTILATYELKEWVVLLSNLSEKVKYIIPPTSDNQDGLLCGGDALECPVFSDMKKYVEDESCSIIMFENPPFSEAGGRSFYDQSSKENTWKNSIVCKNMREQGFGPSSNEKSNVFIWSAFEYYLKKPNDYYVLFAPIKYWKTQNLVKRTFIDGFYCNREHFGTAGPSTISVFLWQNIFAEQTSLPALPAYDIIDGVLEGVTKIEEKKAFFPLSQIYDKASYADDEEGIVCKADGYEIREEEYRTKFSVIPLDNENIIAYLATHGFSPNSQGRILTRVGTANGHGFFVRRENFLKKLPLFAAACFAEDKWYRKDVYSKTSDGGTVFENDEEFLKECLIFTCLTNLNKCISFIGSNGKLYLNELCFDDNTLASKTLNGMALTKVEKSLLADWDVLLEIAKGCSEEYNSKYKYGIYQIFKEINKMVYERDKDGNVVYDPKSKKPKTKPKYPELNGKFNPLKRKLIEYYNNYIEQKLFKYELLK